MRALLSLALLALAACSQEPAEQESADDFANRIGAAQPGASEPLDPSQPTLEGPNTAKPTPPPGADVTDLQKLGDVSGANLGPRNGSCTFLTGGRELMIAVGMNDIAMSGKAVIRVGNGLVLLDGEPGGLDKIKNGSGFAGEGFNVAVAPGGAPGQVRPAKVTVTANDGAMQSYTGEWICA